MYFLRQAIISLAFLALSIASALAQGVALLRDSTVASAETLHGLVPVSLIPVAPARDVTAVILSDTLTTDDLTRIRHEFPPTFTAAFLATHILRIVNISSNRADTSTQLTTPAQLQVALNKLPSIASAAIPAWPTLLTTLAGIPSRLPAQWAHTIIIGRLPSISSDEPFASAWVSDPYRRRRVRVSFWSLNGAAPTWAQNLSGATMGLVGTGVLDSLLPVLNDKAILSEARWESKLPSGAWPYAAGLKNARGERIASIVTFAAAPGFIPPLAAYLSARSAMQATASNEAASQKVLDLNPADIDALTRLARLRSEQNKDKESVALWHRLRDVTPLDGQAWSEAGLTAYSAEAFDEAEQDLNTATGLGAKNRATLELQARLHMRRNDCAGALPFIDEALTGNQDVSVKDQPLLLLRADCAHNSKRWPLEAESLERADALGHLPLEYQTRLIAGYLAANQPDRALAHLRGAANELPHDAAVYAQYADFWEQLRQPSNAAALRKTSTEADPKFAPAYVGLARAALSTKHPADALKLANQGLDLTPESLPLVLAKEEALESLGDLYGARRFLAQNPLPAKDLTLLKRRAHLEDWYGSAGADSYAALLTALVANAAPRSEVIELCRRGVTVALRDEQPQTAKIFADKLASAGDRSGLDLLQTAKSPTVARTEIIGGVDALHFLIFGGGKAVPDRIYADYSRALIALAPANKSLDKGLWQATGQKVHEYFQRVSALIALGNRKPGVVQIQLTLANKPGKQRTQKVFDILGLKLKTGKQGVRVTSLEGTSQIKKQDTLAALAIDDQGIQAALTAGKTYTLEIPVDSVPVFPAAEKWQQAFYAHENYPGGLAEALVTDARLPELYLALSSMDHAAAQALVSGVPLRTLADRYGFSLSLFSAAFALNATHAEVPGGASAEPVWQSLVGASPANPVNFFESLLSKDSGRAIAFFYTLSELDFEHQTFFTRSPQRTKKFYDLFRESTEMHAGGERRLGASAFVEFLRDVPLNDDGSVDFPGAPEVWMVAKGTHTSGSSVAKLNSKVLRTAAPDDEDAILIRLANTGYKSQSVEQSELGNFIAVSRLDAQRDEPLSPESALLLAQGYSQFGGLYPYFAELGDLDAADYKRAFSLETKFEGLDAATINLRLGELHSVLALFGALHESALVPNQNFLAAYRQSVNRFILADNPVAWTNASLGAIDDLAHLVAPANNVSADAAICTLLIGVASHREKAYQRVLGLQNVPSLDALFHIRAALPKVNANPKILDEIKLELATFTVLSIPKTWKLNGDQKKSLESFETATAQNIVVKMREKLAKKKHNPADIEKLANQLIMELEPWTELAMAGRIYARFLDPSDVLVSEDPMLLRKHEFFPLGPKNVKLPYFSAANFFMSSDGAGSNFVGGLAEFSLMAGEARALGNHLGPRSSEKLSGAVIASVRATDWRIVTAVDLQSFAATVRLAREWIVQSAVSAPMRRELDIESRGILSLTRRKALLDGVDHHDWPAVWQTLSVSDLHFLGDELLERAPKELWTNPALNAMKEAAGHAKELDMLGSVAPSLNGTAQPRLRRYEPYEEYQRYFYADRLAQRLSELKLYLAWMADGAAWPPETLADLAAPAADVFLSKIQMHDTWDWVAALEAYRALTPQNLQPLLKQ